MGISRREASEFLKNGDTAFISSALVKLNPEEGSLDPAGFLSAVTELKSLMQVHPAAPFYAGLLCKSEFKALLYSAALDSPSEPARREAILKLVPQVLEAENDAVNILAYLDSAKPKSEAPLLRAACLYRLGLFNDAEKLLPERAEGDWEKALSLFAGWRASGQKPEALRREISSFLFKNLPEEIFTWAYGEALSLDELLSPAELAALSAKPFLRAADYAAALSILQEAMDDGGTVFFLHPELLSDLGRAYQYTPALREEGVKLFRLWEGLTGAGAPGDRYRLLFYLGRIERTRERYAESSFYFGRALELAPDALQSDACIWYMLMNALALDYEAAVYLAIDTMGQWKDASYFDDFLDRLSFRITGRRQWDLLLELFRAMEINAPGCASLSQYAFILGRAAEEGFTIKGAGTAASLAGAASAATVGTSAAAGATRAAGAAASSAAAAGKPEYFFRIAFEAKNGSYYYKTMAASKLGAAFIPSGAGAPIVVSAAPADASRAENADREKAELEFLLGFFECGAASFALPYIRACEERLQAGALEKLAEALAASGSWKDSLDLVSRYTRRENHKMSRKDLLLLYPRPYRDLIEHYAREAGLGPEILYGLIRTESYFMSGIVSRSGATGLAQLMAPTAAEMADRIRRRGGPDYRGGSEGGAIDLKNPEVNIHIGSYYLKYLNEQTGNPMLALLAYNGGLGRIRRALAADKRQKDGGLPADLFLETIDIHETREYGRRVLAAAAVYGYLYYGRSMEDTAADLYKAD